MLSLKAFYLFFKEKLFSNAGIFILIFIAIISIFIFSNSNVILSKFGFETTTTLKSEVIRLENELKTLKTINDKLNKTIEEQNKIYEARIKALIDTFKEQAKTKETIIEIKTKKQTKDKDVIKKLEEKTITTETKVTMPLAEFNTLSENNILSLNETYDLLFSSTEFNKENTL